jgi:transglutaminase-like putative cysteine protease
MRVEIRFETGYRYSAPVSFSTHLYRLFPRAGRDVSVRQASFQTNASALVNLRRDLFDNEIAACEYPEKADRLTTTLLLQVDLLPRNPFGFILSLPALKIPFAYESEQAFVLAPYLAGEPAPALAFWQPPANPAPTVETLVALNSALRENLGYERRDEGVARSPEETARIGGGACRDYAVLLASLLRGLGIAARLVSGYHVETGSGERRAEGAMHAWTEAYLPGAGWIGLDPTNGILCDERHIATAVGLSPMDVAPTLGSFYPKEVSSQMTSSLQVREL